MYFTSWIGLSAKLQNSFRACGYILRKKASSGLWLVPLVPLAVIQGLLHHEWNSQSPISHVYFSTAVVACGLLASTILYLTRFIPRKGILIRDFNTIFLVPAIGTLLVLLFSQTVTSDNFSKGSNWHSSSCGLSRTGEIFTGFLESLLGGLASSYGVLAGLPTLLTLAPGCFTIGEAVLVVHSGVLFLFSAIVNLTRIAFSNANLIHDPVRTFETSTVILQTGVLGFLSLLVSVTSFPVMRQPLCFYSLLGAVAALVLTALQLFLGGSPLQWIIQLFVRDEITFRVLIFWVLCCLVCGCILWHHTVKGQQASTRLRKIFHIIVIAVFSSGIFYAPDLLYLASGVTFTILVLLETLRVANIPPFADSLQSAFLLCRDEKDITLALTPLYLMAGCSLPLWLNANNDIPLLYNQMLPLLSGVLSIGIGDSAASFFGSKFGARKWFGNDRTVEGTAACIISQLAFFYFLLQQEFLYLEQHVILKTIVVIFVVSTVEAKTTQVDNIVLPLLMYVLLLI